MSDGKRVLPKGGSATSRPPPPAACGGCRHWRERPAVGGTRLGLCVLHPPAVPGPPTAHGPRCYYPVTAADTPACAQAAPP
jgi:hypothetical protein